MQEPLVYLDSPSMPFGPRRLLKTGIERGMTAVGLVALSRHILRSRAVVLAYHNIVPDNASPAGDRSLHLELSDFSAQLDELSATHDIVPLQSLLDPVTRPGQARPRAALTFDDAYVGAVTLGVRELVARGLPATVFVAPGYIGKPSFWWDALLQVADADADLETRRTALSELAGEDARIRKWAAQNCLRLSEPPLTHRPCTLDELGQAASTPGISLASHSWGHPNLTCLSDHQLDEELTRPLQWLKERFPEQTFSWISYPYGAANGRVAAAAARSGYSAGLLVDGGWITEKPDRFTLPRLNVPAGVSLEGFRLRTAGLTSR